MTEGRNNQRYRTRKDLLAAAAKLLKAGKSPSLEEVAAEARVSRATVYRYFPSIEQLLVEAPLDGAMPTAEVLFAKERDESAEDRVDRAEAAVHAMVYRNELGLRKMLAASLMRPHPREEGSTPARQNRRMPLIEAALAPVRGEMGKAEYERLCAALAVVFGPEAMVVFGDVLGVDEKKARKVKSWMVRALVERALEDAR